MLLPFDIFRVDGTLDGAKSRVREFMEAWPAEYLVISRRRKDEPDPKYKVK